MGVLLGFSGFFSSSEAALFYLKRRERRAFETGSRAQQVAAHLLEDPERLLTAVLFWNLVTNIAYFAITAIASFRLEQQLGLIEAGYLTVGSLLAIIFFGEMLPKSLAVLHTRLLAQLLALPLSAAVRVLDPLIPVLRTANLLSRRLLCPGFQPEPYLEISDLERAVTLSTSDAKLLHQEENVLQNILLLSDMRVDELMRPRNQVAVFRPPVALQHLGGQPPRSGYILVSEEENDEIAAAIPLTSLPDVPQEHLEHYSEAVSYVPWCASAGDALDDMTRNNRRVTVVVNEFGETIGVLTFDDILDTIFREGASRSARLMNRESIRQVGENVWRVTGMTSLRRLTRYFDLRREPEKNVTVAGVLQEMLQRVPQQDDRCRWRGIEMTVIDIPERGQLLVELRKSPEQREESS